MGHSGIGWLQWKQCYRLGEIWNSQNICAKESEPSWVNDAPTCMVGI